MSLGLGHGVAGVVFRGLATYFNGHAFLIRDYTTARGTSMSTVKGPLILLRAR